LDDAGTKPVTNEVAQASVGGPGSDLPQLHRPAELAARYRLRELLAAGLAGIDALTDAALGR
jgi:hypothetical protein